MLHLLSFSQIYSSRELSDHMNQIREICSDPNKDWEKRVDKVGKTSGPRFNIKTVLSRYGDSYVKDKTAVRTSYL